jgi:hypothetical protein
MIPHAASYDLRARLNFFHLDRLLSSDMELNKHHHPFSTPKHICILSSNRVDDVLTALDITARI